VLDELRSVPSRLALALFSGGAVLAILLALILNSGSGSAAPEKRLRAPQAGAAGQQPGGKAPSKATGDESRPSKRVSVRRLVGQRFMVGLRGADPTPTLLRDAENGELGSILLFPERAPPATVAAAIDKLQAAARAGGNPPLLIATDQEGGSVKRFPQGPPSAPLSSLSGSAALREGAATGHYLRRYGINVDLAPVVDLGLPGSFMTSEGRTISPDPKRVTDVALDFASGLEGGGVMPVAKHFPGLGAASNNTDNEKSIVTVPLGSALEPYTALIESRNIHAGVMVSTAIYTTRDSKHGAAWSPAIVGGLLRGKLGFQGVVISDDLSTHGVEESLPVPEAVVASAEAGVDVLMVGNAEAFRPAYEAVLRAAGDGDLPKGNLASSYERILQAKERFAE